MGGGWGGGSQRAAEVLATDLAYRGLTDSQPARQLRFLLRVTGCSGLQNWVGKEVTTRDGG